MLLILLVHQRRGFKTVRMVEKEKEKNNGVLSQVTSIVRPAKLETKQPPNLENFADAKTGNDSCSMTHVNLIKCSIVCN